MADALSRLELATSATINDDMHNIYYLTDNFGLEDDDLSEDAYPLQYKLIARHQNLQKDLFLKLNKKQDGFHLKSFRGGGKKQFLICRNEKIVIPTTLQNRVVTWYHNILCHSGETRTEQTLRQQFYWPNLREDVHNVCSKCDTCQRTKRSTKKIRIFTPKESGSRSLGNLMCRLDRAVHH
jgi:hypothetical protein